MSEQDPKSILLDVFHELRRGGLSLGVGELMAAFQAVDGGWGEGRPEALREVARLLWCHTPEGVVEFEETFNAVIATGAQRDGGPEPEKPASPMTPPTSEEPEIEPPPSERLPEPLESRVGLTALPVRTPFRPPADETGAELRAYWPMSRRSMLYAWRYLRRPVKDGPRDVLDVEATVERTARQGFFLHPEYDRRETNYAHLVLLVDQGGSMAPFHRFTRDLVDTACEGSAIRQVDVGYFHNVPPPQVFRDPHLTEPLPLERLFAEVTPDSSVLLVSDAGAARGQRSTTRIRGTAEFLARLKRMTTLVAWLNPMPQARWASTSAQFIARLAPMFQMDGDGFGNAVDALRGQLPHPHR